MAKSVHPPPKYKSGDAVPASGIYEVTHAKHRLMHHVTIVKDEAFPKCRKCGTAVTFSLSQPAASQSSGFESAGRLSDPLIPFDQDDPEAAA